MNPNAPSSREIIFVDLERELKFTRKVLERLPEKHFAWKPHQKSMTLGQLAMHVATLPDWARLALAQDDLDASTAPQPSSDIKTVRQLLDVFDKSAAGLRQAASDFDPAKYFLTWTFRRGNEIVTSNPRATVYRTWSLNHLIHHRAQLCVYLRLLDVPVPTVYFNSADEPTWVFE